MGGTFVLRIEDIDTTRCKPEFTAAIFEDLAWLGLQWEEPVWEQSTRLAEYQAAAGRINRLGLLYPCFCSRAEIAEHSTDTDPDGAPLYPGTCRHLTQAEVDAHVAAGRRPQWRLDVAEAMDQAGVVTFSVAAPQPDDRPQVRYARPERWGDVVLVRKDTPTSYHLSVVVDDAAQHISHVTRGRDMEAATDIHALLQMLLGLPAPIYSFHRLILAEDGRKLAKSKGAPALAELRAAGWTPAAIRERLGLD